jgi:hypothetical protein
MLISDLQRAVTRSALQRNDYMLQDISMLPEVNSEVIAPRSTAVRYMTRYEHIDFSSADDGPGCVMIPHEQYLRIGENGQFTLLDQHIPERRYIEFGDNCFFSMYSVTEHAKNVVITGKNDCSVIIKDRLCDDFRLEGDSYVCKILREDLTIIVVLKGTLTMTIDGESLIFPEHTRHTFYPGFIDTGKLDAVKVRINTDLGMQRAENNRFRYA